MKTVIETFVYQIPDDCEKHISVKDFIEFVDGMTCSFYDGGDEFVPEFDNHTIEIKE